VVVVLSYPGPNGLTGLSNIHLPTPWCFQCHGMNTTTGFSGCSAYSLDVMLGYCFADFAEGVLDNGKDGCHCELSCDGLNFG
jgi:hypothetical protein